MSQKQKPTLEDSKIKTVKVITDKKKIVDVETELRKLVADKDAEINRLNRKIETLTKVEKIQINDEEMIAIMQLQRLKGVAQTRELTLEESRKFEIFSKIKNSVNQSKPMDTAFTRLSPNLNSNALLQIANGKKLDK